jgi:apolipoprotein N-acyltransferase
VGVLSGALAGTGTLVTAGVVALVLVVLLGTVADHAPDGGSSVGAVSTAAVQGGGAHGVDKSQVHPAQVLSAQLAAMQRLQALDGGRAPGLVLWPEDVVSLDVALSQSPEESVLSALAASLHTTLVVGVTENISTTAFRNEVVAWGPDGTLVARFEKVHRVPFGEYVPYRGFFSHLASLSSVPLDAIPGTGTGLMETPAAPLGAMVSFEVFYASRGRASVRAGAELLIVPTNTASYATSQVPTQELAAATIQAVQQGRDLLQAAPTGFSAAIDHRGVLEARSVIGARQVIFATLDRRDGTTLYVRFGDLPVLVLAAAALLAGWWIALRRHARRGSASAARS